MGSQRAEQYALITNALYQQILHSGGARVSISILNFDRMISGADFALVQHLINTKLAEDGVPSRMFRLRLNRGHYVAEIIHLN